MSRVAEVMAALDAELAEHKVRAEEERARAEKLYNGLTEVASILERYGLKSTEARGDIHEGATAAVWAERCQEELVRIGLLNKSMTDVAELIGQWLNAATVVGASLDLVEPTAAESPAAWARRTVLGIEELQAAMDNANMDKTRDPIREAIDLSETWSVADVERELSKDPLFLARLLGPNRVQEERAAAYAANVAPAPVTAPRQQKIPDDALRFAVNVHELTDDEACALWWSLPEEDCAAKFRAMLTEKYVAEVVARRTTRPVAEAHVAAEGPPTEKQDTRSRTEATSPCPDVAALLYPAIYEHGNKCGFDKAKVEALAEAFRAEALKADRRATRWGSTFRGYLTEIARLRDRAR